MSGIWIYCVIAGALGGFLQGLLGVGMGLVIVPLLTFLLPYYGVPDAMAIHIAIATSMGAIAISSIASFLSHHSRGNVLWHIFYRMVVFSLVGSCLGAIAAGFISPALLSKIFAIFMFFTAFRLFRKKTNQSVEMHDVALSQPLLSVGGLTIGIVASIIGIGGGLFMVPFLHWQKISMRQAVGTSTLLSLPVAFMGTVTYMLTGDTGLPMMVGYLAWPLLIAISIGSVFFAPLGAKLSSTLSGVLLQRLFATSVLLVGIKMLI